MLRQSYNVHINYNDNNNKIIEWPTKKKKYSISGNEDFDTSEDDEFDSSSGSRNRININPDDNQNDDNNNNIKDKTNLIRNRNDRWANMRHTGMQTSNIVSNINEKRHQTKLNCFWSTFALTISDFN